MALFEKRNPKATARSVLKHALVTSIAGAVVFVLFFKDSYKEDWPVTLPVWMVLCGAVGALWEWQVSNSN